MSAERPEKVICLECGGGFNLLHRSHLIVHGYNSQAEYRKVHGISDNEPLNSQEHAEVLSKIHGEPDKRRLSSLMGKDWQLRRRVALVLLERVDFYTPGRASDITHIPIQTIHSAIKRGALPSSQRELLVETEGGLIVSCDKIIRGIKLEDMLEFVKHHKPKYSSS